MVGAPGALARLHRRSELPVDEGHLLPVGLLAITLGRPPRLVGENEGVALDAGHERLVHTAPCGRAQVAVEAFEPAPVEAQGQSLVLAERLFRRPRG